MSAAYACLLNALCYESFDVGTEAVSIRQLLAGIAGTNDDFRQQYEIVSLMDRIVQRSPSRAIRICEETGFVRMYFLAKADPF